MFHSSNKNNFIEEFVNALLAFIKKLFHSHFFFVWKYPLLVQLCFIKKGN
jgi:hypothetical protein